MADAYGLGPAVAQDLLLSNISLLAVARALDDLADDELDEPLGEAVILTSSLQHLWASRYVRLFDGPRLARFWSYFDDFAARWLRAMLPPSPAHQPVPLAERGALLRVACAAGCVAADREDVLTPLVSGLDDLLVGVVLLDDAFDWNGDVQAGRPNALVAFCSDLPQTEANRVSNRSAVLHGLYAADVLPEYFRVAGQCLESALRWCERAECAGLAAFVSWYAGEVDRCAQWMRARACDQVQTWALAQQASPAPREPSTAPTEGGGPADDSITRHTTRRPEGPTRAETLA
jgi:hypothetical protein